MTLYTYFSKISVEGLSTNMNHHYHWSSYHNTIIYTSNCREMTKYLSAVIEDMNNVFIIYISFGVVRTTLYWHQPDVGAIR